MAFRFPLASVLRLRESLEDKEERALQKIQMAMNQVAAQIDELTADISKSHAAKEQAMKQPIAAIQIEMFQWQMRRAVERRQALHRDLAALAQARDKQMELYQSAHIDCKTLSDMSDKLQDAYEFEQDRVQQISLDDIHISRRHQS